MAYLRDHRCHQTEPDIQAAAGWIVLANDYDHVTTSMIAEDCGLSVRTFFNYHKNRDAAISGQKNTLTPILIGKFIASDVLSDDLERFVIFHLESIAAKRALMRDILTISKNIPRVQLMQAARGSDIPSTLSETLRLRLGPKDADLAETMTDIALSASSNSYCSWLEKRCARDGRGRATDI